MERRGELRTDEAAAGVNSTLCCSKCFFISRKSTLLKQRWKVYTVNIQTSNMVISYHQVCTLHNCLLHCSVNRCSHQRHLKHVRKALCCDVKIARTSLGERLFQLHWILWDHCHICGPPVTEMSFYDQDCTACPISSTSFSASSFSSKNTCRHGVVYTDRKPSSFAHMERWEI